MKSWIILLNMLGDFSHKLTTPISDPEFLWTFLAKISLE